MEWNTHALIVKFHDGLTPTIPQNTGRKQNGLTWPKKKQKETKGSKTKTKTFSFSLKSKTKR